MKPYKQPEPTILVIFGGGGDLTWRKLMPAMYTLHLDKWLGEKFQIIAIDAKKMSKKKYHDHLCEGVNKFGRYGKTKKEMWEKFILKIDYKNADFDNLSIFHNLAEELSQYDKKWKTVTNKIFYLAVPPILIRTIAQQLGKARLAKDHQHNRIVVEKPFGFDFESAKQLNNKLKTIFEEDQLYRIDHFLGKETVQNIMAFRFANSLFEPIWNRRYIDHIQITVAENLGVGHRGAYYEKAGALRDMVQNHLLQLMCLTAMEPPVSYQADEIRNKKVDVLRAIRTIAEEQVPQFAVRGQYGQGWISGEHVSSYRQEESVNANSATETYAAVKFFVDNWRWQDVPFYLRTGKRMHSRISDIVVQFRSVPHQSFPSTALTQPQPNRLTIHIQPEEGIRIRFQAKKPGEMMELSPADMRFLYRETFHQEPPEAYETLLLDVMLGDSTQFMRADQLELAWQVITPIINVWESVEPTDFPNYDAGSMGPESGEVLIAQDGRVWHVSEESTEETEEK
jgi:glucose-6-phosphate 1-dehydrogenase